VDSKCSLYALFSYWPYTGISVLSMSSSIRCGARTVLDLPMSSRLKRAKLRKFSSSASISVTRVCKREVSGVPRSRGSGACGYRPGEEASTGQFRRRISFRARPLAYTFNG